MAKKIRTITRKNQEIQLTIEDDETNTIEDMNVSIDTYTSFFFYEGKDITKEYDDFYLEHYADMYRKKMIRYLEYKERTIYEVKKKLRSYVNETFDTLMGDEANINTVQIDNQITDIKLLQAKLEEKLITYFTQLGYLDDQRYVEEYIKTQLQTTRKSLYRIEQTLYEKGISKAYVKEHLELNEKQYEAKEYEHAHALARQLQNKKKDYTRARQCAKIRQTIQMKGFRFSVIDQIVSEISVEEDDRSEDLEVVYQRLSKAYKLEQNRSTYKRKYEKSPYEAIYYLTQRLRQKGYTMEQIEYIQSQQSEI